MKIKNSRKIICLLILIEVTSIFSMYKSLANKDSNILKTNNETSSGQISYIMLDENDIEEEGELLVWPTNHYYYKKSKCFNLSGDLLGDLVVFDKDNNLATYNTNKISKCTLYFKKDDKVPNCKFDNNWSTSYVRNGTSATIELTCEESESGLKNNITFKPALTNTSTGNVSVSEPQITSNKENDITKLVYTITYTGTITSGDNTVSIPNNSICDRANNCANNLSTPKITNDATAPQVSATANMDGTANVTVIENGSGVSAYCISTSNTCSPSINISSNSFVTSSVPSSGTYYIRVMDKAGNVGTSSAISIQLGATFTYTGNFKVKIGSETKAYKNQTVSLPGNKTSYVFFTSSGILTITNTLLNQKLFMVGPGGDGGGGSSYLYYGRIDYRSGAGGNGGQTKYVDPAKYNGTYEITISSSKTSFGTITASKGGGKAGGTALYAWYEWGAGNGNSGANGVYAFDDSSIDGVRYGASGASGGVHGGSGGSGGKDGAGNGGGSGNGSSASQANTGAGGGGGGSPAYDGGASFSSGGSGTTGIIIMKSY